MSNDTPLWEPGTRGVHVILVQKSGTTMPVVWGDPRLDADDAADDIADIATDYPEMPVAALLIGPDGNGGLTVSDATADLIGTVRQRRADRDDDQEFSPEIITKADPIVAHIARWADGDYGCLANARAADGAASLRDDVVLWTDTWGGHPSNQGLTGLILRIEKDAAGWRAEPIEHIPAPEEGPGLGF